MATREYKYKTILTSPTWRVYEDYCREKDAENRNALGGEALTGKQYAHHIRPRSCFPELEDLNTHPENCAMLTHTQHLVAHILVVKAFDGVRGMRRQFHKMCRAARLMWCQSADESIEDIITMGNLDIERHAAMIAGWDAEAAYAESKGMTVEEWRKEKKRKMIAKRAAYHAAHREEILAKQVAYYAAHREDKRAYDAAHYAAHYAAHREERIAKQVAYYAAHREERIAKQAAYYAAHREEILAKQVAYYAAHREEILAKHAAHRAAHREDKRAYNAAYYAAHREEIRAYRAANREIINLRKRTQRQLRSSFTFLITFINISAECGQYEQNEVNT